MLQQIAYEDLETSYMIVISIPDAKEYQTYTKYTESFSNSNDCCFFPYIICNLFTISHPYNDNMYHQMS